MSLLLFLVITVCLGASGVLIAALLGLRGAVAFVLGAYVIAWAELVVLVALLSAVTLVRVEIVAPLIVVVLGACVLTWHRFGRPALPSPRRTLRSLSAVLRDPPLAILAAVVALAFFYLTALALLTPANSWDALWYHLPRAAFWSQHHSVDYIDGANTILLNAHPPGRRDRCSVHDAPQLG